MRVAIRRKNLVDVAFAGADEFQNGDIEGAAAKIVDGYVAALLFVQAISERGCGWFVDETQDFEAGKAAGVFGGLALRVVEIGWDGDDCTVDCIVEMFFRPGFELAKNISGNFWRREKLVAQANADHVAAFLVDAEWEAGEFVLNVCYATAHQALDGIDRAVRICEQALAGRIAHENPSIGVHADDGGT